MFVARNNIFIKGILFSNGIIYKRKKLNNSNHRMNQQIYADESYDSDACGIKEHCLLIFGILEEIRWIFNGCKSSFQILESFWKFRKGFLFLLFVIFL